MASILVVDDEEMIVRIRAMRLRKEGHIVETAYDGEEAWHKISRMQPPPDLLITDYNMPRITGLELCKLIKQDQQLHSVRVIICTVGLNRPMVEVVDEVFEAGADDFLIGADYEKLRTAVRVVLKETP